MNETYQVIILSLATAAISTTISKGSIFNSAREWIAKHSEWLGKLIHCSYCTSHWVAITFVVIYQPFLIRQWIVADIVVSVFTIVALASVVSGLIIKLIPFKQADPAEEVEQLYESLQAARDKITEQSETIRKLGVEGGRE